MSRPRRILASAIASLVGPTLCLSPTAHAAIDSSKISITTTYGTVQQFGTVNRERLLKAAKADKNFDWYSLTQNCATAIAGHYLCIDGTASPCDVMVQIYGKAYRTCAHYNMDLVSECSTGTIYWAPNVLVWGRNYTYAGLRGSHACDADGSTSTGYSVDVTSCGEHRFANSYMKQWDTFKMCVFNLVSCVVVGYHNNMYWSGYISQTYNGS